MKSKLKKQTEDLTSFPIVDLDRLAEDDDQQAELKRGITGRVFCFHNKILYFFFIIGRKLFH